MKINKYDNTAIITRDRNISYTEMIQKINYFARETPLGGKQKVQENSKVMIFCENREGWIYAFFSIWNNKAIAVPVDASSTVDDVAYILNDCRPEAVWTSLALVETIRKAIDKSGVEVKILIIDDYENADTTAVHTDSIEYTPSDVALIIYTSGTTGSPKGVMLSFANLFANMRGVCEEVHIFDETTRALMLLPLHHVLPLMGTMIIPILQGGGVAICQTMTGADIMDTLCRGKVSIFVGVPRLWQMLYTGIKKKIDEKAITRGLFSLCKTINSKRLSRFIFQSVHKKLGGNITYCVSGGAALDKEIGEGLRTLGLDVLEGYGMTETAPIITFTRPGDIIPGCVGLPLPSVQCKIVDGELCAKGPNLMLGYYNRPEETADVIDKDGFIHTGDLATIDEKGRVTITGRKKEIIVLSNGKNVQPNEIEFQIEKFDDKVKECAITEKNDMLLAIIVPQEEWANGKTDAEIETLLKREVIEQYNLTVENYKKVMRLFVYFGDIPRTRMDKIQRFKLKDIIESKIAAKPSAFYNPEGNNEKEDDTASYSDEFKIIKRYIEEEKNIKVMPESHIETDLAFDSLDRVSLQSFIEQSFGITINAAEIALFPNLKAMADYIAREKTKSEAEHINWNLLLNSQSQQSSKAMTLPSTSPTLVMARNASKAMFKIYNRLTIKGTENIPAKGPFILAANHQSFIDGPLVVSGMNSKQLKDCYFYATEEHVQSAVLKYLAHHNNIILMEKRNLKNSILKLGNVLKNGKNVVIFPEGSRTHSGEIGKFRKMFAILATELNVPILPVVVRGAYDALPRGQHSIRPKHIEIEYLPTVRPHGTYDDFANEIRNIINDKLHS